MKKILAVDIGEKRIGLSYNRGTSFATPLKVIPSESLKKNVKNIIQIAQQIQAEIIVLGLPLRLDHSIKNEAQKIIKIRELLSNCFPGEVVLFDERLTTKEAEKRLLEADVSRKKRKMVIDQLAATIILQTYIDSTQV
ncbi:MAG: Holliday junction resolvase RuvX [Candidatus Atribacteria bacterium]|nr:Holliday junction resolvase RuvX [Candidatus Atribacteria bacterium]